MSYIDEEFGIKSARSLEKFLKNELKEITQEEYESCIEEFGYEE